jgi:DNA-binding CsgD family transcriptional regulator
MTVCHPKPIIASPSNILSFARPEYGQDATSDRALAKRETELRAALENVQVLRRQCGEMSQREEGGVLPALFAAPESVASRVASLTLRQREVMDMVLAGRANKIIAWELGISQRTVENHRAAVMAKTGSKSIPELVRFAISAARNGGDGSNIQRVARAAFPVAWQGTGDAKSRADGDAGLVEGKFQNAIGGLQAAVRDVLKK